MKSAKNLTTASILKFLAMTGLVLVALSSPYGGIALIRALKHDRHRKVLKARRSEFMKMLWYLRKRKYVEVVEESDSGVTIKILAKGIERVRKFDLDNLKLNKTQPWDEKWRIVIFDIPNTHAKNRNLFRNKLRELGFIMLQKSVWVCPWNCLDEMVFLRKMLNVEQYVSLVLADGIESEINLRRHFNLQLTSK